MPQNLDDGSYAPAYIKAVTVEAKIGTPRLHDTGQANTDIFPLSVVLTDPTGNAYTASSGGGASTSAVPASQNYDVTTAATGYAVGDVLSRVVYRNLADNSTSSLWFNLTQGTLLSSAPVAGNIKETTQNLVIGGSLPPGTNNIGLVNVNTQAYSAGQNFDVLTAATGYAVGDVLSRVLTQNATSGAISSAWFNLTQGTILASAPAAANIKENTSNFTITGKSTIVSATPTITSGSAYSAKQEVGGLLTFANAFGSALSGIVQSAHISVKSVHSEGMKLYLFNQQPTATTWTDKTTPSINASDIPYLIDVFNFPASDNDLGSHSLYVFDGIGKAVKAATTSLYGILTTTANPTYSSTTDITVSLGILQD